MKLKEFINKTIYDFLNENNIELLKNTLPSVFNNIEGRFLNKKQAEKLQKEIEANYIDGDIMQHFNREKHDIRMNMFNYDNPVAEKNINGINLRIVEGLIRNGRKTYLLYVDGRIVGEFYNINEIKIIIKYIEDNLIKNKLN